MNGLQLLYCGDGMELRPFVMFDGNHVSLFGHSGEDRFSDEGSDHFETESSKGGQLCGSTTLFEVYTRNDCVNF